MNLSYDLSHLDPHTFEHLVNSLALRVLGSGHTTFGPGSDGGRDGYFEGQANYPSTAEQWSGRWYIQAKFHAPHLTHDAQKWLVEQVKSELQAFAEPSRQRTWPDILIIATNIEPSGHPMTGAFDTLRSLVAAARPQLADRFHVWGGRKIIDWLGDNPDIARRYGHFLTPGHVISRLIEQFEEDRPGIQSILHAIVVPPFVEQQYTKLEQAGSASDVKPGIHAVFVDLPFRAANNTNTNGNILNYLHRTSARNHRLDADLPVSSPAWSAWQRHPGRSRTWLVKGGPGQGKSTLGQYFAQIQRAALILQGETLRVNMATRELALQVQARAKSDGVWPISPRVPIHIELKDYAHWRSRREPNSPTGVLTYLGVFLSEKIEQSVPVGTLKRLFEKNSWFFAFDGLDEVPADAKDALAIEVGRFADDVLVSLNADAVVVCTSRPQGYSGQFDSLDGCAILTLLHLTPEQALKCAQRVVSVGRSAQEAAKAMAILSSAVQATSVQELMKTPLQAHIMAVIVRDGRHPPERKWALFTTFYDVIYRREATKEPMDPALRRLFQKDAALLRTVHERVGFVLHARAERSAGAITSMSRDDFRELVEHTVVDLKDTNLNDAVEIVMTAATTRLVLLNTPDAGDQVRFDVRQLQEFFAASYLHDNVNVMTLRRRLEIIAGDSHWIEVTHFLVSALVETRRTDELSCAIGVLLALDGAETEYSRLFNRRLARGALAAVKLLEDGVLEQDKRVRVRFEPVAITLASITDPQVLLTLQGLAPESKFWIQNLMMRALMESSGSEAIGAGILLALMIDQTDERAARVIQFWDATGCVAGDLLAAVADMLRERLHDFVPGARTTKAGIGENSIVFGILENFLAARSWCEREYWSAVEILRSDEAANWRKVTERCRPFRIKVLSLPREDKVSDEEVVERSGFRVRTVSFRVGCDDPAIIELALDAPAQEEGYFALVAAAARFAVEPTRARAMQLINASGGDWYNLFVVPRRLLPYVPIVQNGGRLRVDELVAGLEALDDITFEAELANRRLLGHSLGPTVVGLHMDENRFSNEQHMDLFKIYPEIAIEHWADQQDLALPEEMIKTFSSRIDIIARLPQVWGKFVSMLGDDAGVFRKRLCVEVGATASLSLQFLEHRPIDLSPFTLCLPEEDALLPVLACSIVTMFIMGARYREHVRPLTRGEPPGRPDLAYSTVVHGYISDITDLGRIIEDQSRSPKVRVAAIVFEALHGNGGLSHLLGRSRTIIELASRADTFDTVTLISCCVEILGAVDDSNATDLLGGMFDAGRQYWCQVQRMNWFLRRWRAFSRSPVRSTQHEVWSDVSRFLDGTPGTQLRP